MTDNQVRKSKRQPVPNPLYQQGISQLKSQNPARSKRRTKNNEQENVSNEEERNSQINNQQSLNFRDSKQQYLPCRMPDGSHKRIKFIVEAKKQEKKKQKQYVPPPARTAPANNNNNNKKQTNLLSLFYQAIEGADHPQEGSLQENSLPKTPQIPIERQKIVPMRQKRSRNSEQDYIKKISIQNKNMKIVHSQLEQINIPVNWQPSQIPEMDQQQIEQMKKKLENCKILKNISILMA